MQPSAKVMAPLPTRVGVPSPEEARIYKMQELHKDQQAKAEAILTDAQKKQWKEMLGKPFNLGD